MSDTDVSSSSPTTGGALAVTSQTTTNTNRPMGTKLMLPPFTCESANTWFRRAEVHFRLQKITDDQTRSDLVMSMLPPEVFNKISTWLNKLKGPLSYQDLRAHLTARYAIPVTVRAQRALDLMSTPLGDTSPEDAAEELMSLVQLDGPGNGGDDGPPGEISLTREIFLRRLPKNIRAQLGGAENIDFVALVAKTQELYLADRASRYAATATINAVEPTAPIDAPSGDDQMEVFAVQTRQPFFARQRPPPLRYTQHQQQQQQQRQQPRRQRHVSRESSDCNPTWCYYHLQFGDKARKCSPPCRYPKNV